MQSLLEHMALAEGISYLVSIAFASGFIGFWRYLTGREVPATVPVRFPDVIPDMVQGFAIPANVFCHPRHGWATLEAGGLVRIGVDDFLPTAIGHLDAVVLPRPGDPLVAGGPAFSLIQGQRRADVPAPVSGVVAEVNPMLASRPSLLKERPFGAGWAVRVRPTALGEELPRLHVAERARPWLEGEATRLREFVLAHADQGGVLGRTMADGGDFADGLLESLDDEAWREFVGGGDHDEGLNSSAGH
jgi:glycine cleavage system H protein